MKQTRRFIVILVLASALIAGLLSWRFLQTPAGQSYLVPPEGLEYVVLADPIPVPDFKLTDDEGHAFGNERLKGRWSLLFFGYTHCPDVCPTTLAMVKGALQRLADKPKVLDELQVLFISLDPRRDTPESLKTYVHYFDPRFTGATGTQPMIDQLARALRVAYMVEGDVNSNDYVVNHSANLLIIDPQGRLYAQIGPPHTPAGIADTFLRVREFYKH